MGIIRPSKRTSKISEFDFFENVEVKVEKPKVKKVILKAWQVPLVVPVAEVTKEIITDFKDEAVPVIKTFVTSAGSFAKNSLRIFKNKIKNKEVEKNDVIKHHLDNYSKLNKLVQSLKEESSFRKNGEERFELSYDDLDDFKD